MNKRKLIIIIGSIISALILCAAIVVGLIFRKNHRQIIKQDDNGVGDVYVSLMDEEMGDYYFEERDLFTRFMETSEYILKIRCTENPTFAYQSCLEHGEVLKVFKGDGSIETGDEINIYRGHYHLWIPENGLVGEDSMNMCYTNFMKTGKEYLVFLSEKYNSELYEFDIYSLGDLILPPAFCYEDLENVIVEGTSQVKYSVVKENEYFVGNEQTEKQIYDFKHRVLSETDSEYVVPSEK